MTHNQIYYAVGALAAVVLLMGGGKVVYDNSGSPTAKRAVTLNELCHQLKLRESKEYVACQNTLDLLLKDLMDRGVLDAKTCRRNPADATTAFCPVKVWYTNRNVVVKIPGIVQLANGKVQNDVEREIKINKRSVDQRRLTIASMLEKF